jgi:proteic killer suppression protein
MIKNIIHKGLRNFFIDDDKRMLNLRDISRINRLLDLLDSATQIEDINIPGYELHKLSGNKKSFWSVKVNRNWRITFQFENGHVYDVDLEDYH